MLHYRLKYRNKDQIEHKLQINMNTTPALVTLRKGI